MRDLGLHWLCRVQELVGTDNYSKHLPMKAEVLIFERSPLIVQSAVDASLIA